MNKSKKLYGGYVRLIITGITFMCFSVWLGVVEYNETLAKFPYSDLIAESQHQLMTFENNRDFSFAVLGDNKRHLGIYSKMLDKIQSDPEIDFLLTTGDMVPTGSAEQFKDFVSVTKDHLKKPFLPTCGNHDIEVAGDSNYKDIFGPLFYHFKVGLWHFFSIDTTRPITDEQFAKIGNYLDSLDDSEKVAFYMHIPPMSPKGINHSLEKVDADRLMKFMKQQHVDYFFAGHVHGFFEGVYQGIPWTITGGAGANMKGNDPKHYFYHYVKVTVKGDQLTTTAVRFDRSKNRKRVGTFIKTVQLEYGEILLMFISALSGLYLLILLFSIIKLKRGRKA